MRRLGLIAALMTLAAWIPAPELDLTTLALTSDAAVLAKRVGDELHEGRTVGTYAIVHAVHGAATGTIAIDDGAYRHPDESPLRLLFLKRLSADEQARWKLPAWIVQYDGARIVVRGEVHDFHAEDARFRGGSGSFLDHGSRSVMVTHAQTRDDPAFDPAKTGPVVESELLDAAKRAFARAAELRAVKKLPADARRRARLLALLPAPRPAGPAFTPHTDHPELLDIQVMHALIEAADAEGILEALPRVRNDDGSWHHVLSTLAVDATQPEPLRVRAILARGAHRGVLTPLLAEPAAAIRAAVAETAIGSPCLASWEKTPIDRAVRVEKDPVVRALLVRADRKRQCPSP
jgi:hypothetical protein